MVQNPSPSSIGSERAVISSILMNPSCVVRACGRLAASDFYDSGTREVYQAITALNRCGKPVDSKTVYAELVGRGGDGLAVFEMVENSPTCGSATFEGHVNIVLEQAARRRVIDGCDRLSELAGNSETSIDAVRRGADSILDSLSPVLTATGNLPAVVSMRDLVALPPMVTEAVVSGVLRKRHKMILAGPSKAGKSFLAINLGLSLATGQEFLSFPCRLSRVLFVNFEIDAGSFFYRVKAVAGAMGIDPDLEGFSILNLRGRCLSVEDLVDGLVVAGKGFDVIILDPLYKLLRSKNIREMNENGCATMSAVLDELDRGAESLGAALVIVDHYSKGLQGGKAAIDRVAGSGAKGRDADAVLTLSELEKAGAYRIEFTLREFASPDPIDVCWDYPLHRRDEGLKDLSVRGAGGRQCSVDDSALRTAVEEGVVHVAALAKRFGVSERTVKNSVRRLSGFRVVHGRVESGNNP